jgi:hypothetical protein
MRFIFFLGVFLFILSSCIKMPITYSLRPTEQKTNMELIYVNGASYIISPQNGSTIELRCWRVDNELSMNITCANTDSIKRINFFPDSIKVSGTNQLNNISSFKIITADQIMDEAYKWASRSVATQVALNNLETQNAGYSFSNTNSSASGSVANSDGSKSNGTANNSSSTVTYDISKEAEAKARGEQKVEEIKKNNSAALTTLSQNLLRTTTIFPKQKIEGIVKSEFKEKFSDKIYITIPVGNSTHEFVFIK